MVNTAATAMAPNRQDFTVDLTVTKAFGSGAPNSLTVGVGMEMLGPGDVLGLAPGQVIRTEPADRATGVETTLFPSVEFAEPALPWLLTPGPENAGWPGGPAPPPGGHQLLPWICLVVVPDTDGITLDTSAGRLTIAARADARQQLPDLREAWAWAHVQYAGDLDADATGSGGQPALATAAATTLTARPGTTLSRLVCPRQLADTTRYFACVVPTTMAGCIAGLGGSPGQTAPGRPGTSARPWR